MERRSSQTSKVHLFCTQMAEQIERLRVVLQNAADNGSAVDVVNWKRALMATRLLAGSARVLGESSLHDFLKRLTRWLEALNNTGPPTTTQLMVLESVVALEEEVLRKVQGATELPDLSGFEADLGELTQLLVFPSRPTRPAPEPRAQPEQPAALEPPELQQRAAVDPPAPEQPVAVDPPAPEQPVAVDPPALEQPVAVDLPAPPPADPVKVADATTLTSLLGEMKSLEHSIQEGRATEATWARLQELAARLNDDMSRMRGDASAHEPAATGEPSRPASAPAASEVEPSLPASAPAAAAADPVVQHLARLVDQRAQRSGVPISVRAYGSFTALHAGLRDVVTQILGNLVEDLCDGFGGESLRPEGHHIELEIAVDHRRARIALRDNGDGLDPSLEIRGDHLATYRGLRRSRPLVAQLNGLVWVEPVAGTRFMVQLPTDLRAQSYCLLESDGAMLAVPWVLVDDILPSSGIVFHADSRGESFQRGGLPVPLVELSADVPGLATPEDPAEFVVIVGLVEKRVAFFCNDTLGFIQTSQVVDVPKGWEQAAYGGLQVERTVVPILDVERLVARRLDMLHEAGEGSGLGHGAAVDSYLQQTAPAPDTPSAALREPAPPPGTIVPPEPAAAATAPAPRPAPVSSTRRALLINQSEYRRRELSRALHALGYSVVPVADLPAGLHQLQQHTVALIVTDLRLGGIDHSDMLGSLRQGREDVPLVLTSSVSRESAQELAHRTGVDSCWVEPFHPQDLQAFLTTRS